MRTSFKETILLGLPYEQDVMKPIVLTAILEVIITSRRSWKRPFRRHSIITPSLGQDHKQNTFDHPKSKHNHNSSPHSNVTPQYRGLVVVLLLRMMCVKPNLVKDSFPAKVNSKVLWHFLKQDFGKLKNKQNGFVICRAAIQILTEFSSTISYKSILIAL